MPSDVYLCTPVDSGHRAESPVRRLIAVYASRGHHPPIEPMAEPFAGELGQSTVAG